MSSCLPGTCTYHLTYKISPKLGLRNCFQYPEVNRQFLAITVHTSKYIDIDLWGYNLGPANKLPSAGEASDL
jgi:hypothetical protein